MSDGDGAKGSGDPGGAAESERSSIAEDAVDLGVAAVTSSRGWVPEDWGNDGVNEDRDRARGKEEPDCQKLRSRTKMKQPFAYGF